jgi:hypothetical protein
MTFIVAIHLGKPHGMMESWNVGLLRFRTVGCPQYASGLGMSSYCLSIPEEAETPLHVDLLLLI